MIASISRPERPLRKFPEYSQARRDLPNDYRNLEHLGERIQEFIEAYYNQCRFPHWVIYRQRSSRNKPHPQPVTSPGTLRRLQF